MREIKFRAWNIGGERWMSPGDVRLATDFDKDDNMSFIVCGIAMNGVAFMQFTGLKDKNGKEIYEGDIVLVKRDSDLIGGETKDIWKTECLWAFNSWRFSNIIDPDDYIPTEEINEYEVIGNIYENPELLEAKHG